MKQEFNYGEEFVLLIELKDDALGELAEDALCSLHRIAMESPSLIVQVSQGAVFELNLVHNIASCGFIVLFSLQNGA